MAFSSQHEEREEKPLEGRYSTRSRGTNASNE